jgi:hypothetical protein
LRSGCSTAASLVTSAIRCGRSPSEARSGQRDYACAGCVAAWPRRARRQAARISLRPRSVRAMRGHGNESGGPDAIASAGAGTSKIGRVFWDDPARAAKRVSQRLDPHRLSFPQGERRCTNSSHSRS